MKVKKITAEGFKSMYKETIITFNEDGLWKIVGDVGAGKTTLGECVLFGLFGNVKDTNIKDLISWGAKKCTVSIELESRGHNLLINRMIRGKGQGSLDIYIDGELLEYTNKRSGQQILEEDYYDVSRTAIESLCIISLNNFKSIVHLSSGSAETRKFIDDVFGFNIINNYIEKAKNHLLETTTKYNNISSSIDTLELQRDKYINTRDNINENINCEEIDSINKQIKDKEKELGNLQMEYVSKSGWWQTRKEENMKQMNIIKERGKHVKDTIDKLKNGICPLCGGKVEPESIEEYNKQRDDLLAQYQTFKKSYDEASVHLQETIDNTKIETNKINKEINSLKSEISKINIQQKLLSNNYDKLINDIEVTINEKKVELNTIESDMHKWQELYDKLYKESRPALLKHYIPALNKNINYYMQELSQPYIVKFDETFKCTISAYGVDNIPASSLSTGQSKLVDIGVILGILKTLLNGINFNIFFIDELFGNMHSELRNTMCDMLKRNVPNKLIYVITHAEIEDSYFNGKIKVKLHHWEEDDHLIQNSEYNVIKLCE